MQFAAFRALEDGIDVRIQFCDPCAPWLKGAIENASERIRRFLPSDLSQMSQEMLNQIARILTAENA